MCIAILNKTENPLTKKALRNCWVANNDGAGLLYVENGELKVFKEMYNFKKLVSEYRRIIDEVKPKYVVLHFRIATHGGINIENCHPFLVSEELGFVHNGIISNTTKMSELLKSDTNIFNEKILQHLTKEFIYSEVGKELILEYIGFSKLIFLDKQESPMIVGEHRGDWVEGNWFSNSSWKDAITHSQGGTWQHRDGYTIYKKTHESGFKSSADFYEKHTWSVEKQQYILKPEFLGLEENNSEFENDEIETCDNCECDLIHEYEINVHLCNQCITIFDLQDKKQEESLYSTDHYKADNYDI